jgi:hypothetical protein
MATLPIGTAHVAERVDADDGHDNTRGQVGLG